MGNRPITTVTIVIFLAYSCYRDELDVVIDSEENFSTVNEERTDSTIGKEGGTITLMDGASVTIPPLALLHETHIQFQILTDSTPPLPEGYVASSSIYRIEPLQQRFEIYVSLAIPYRINDGEMSCQTFMRLADEQSRVWEPVEGGVFQDSMGRIRLLRFGIYRAVQYICDAGSDGGIEAGGIETRTMDSCLPTSCEAEGKNCGEIEDGCGNIISCGTCRKNHICNDDNFCECTPTVPSCPHECGVMDDGCGGTLHCGDGCDKGEVCQDNKCICTPTVTECDLQCGTLDDGCGNLISCGGPCAKNQKCIDHTCCHPSITSCDLECGSIDDGCGNRIDCGSCGEHEVCKGNSCKPLPCTTTVTECDFQCGTIDDGCGNPLSCGEPCAGNQKCIDHACICQPSITSCDLECGSIDDGCGNRINCGSCGEHEVCEGNFCRPLPCTPTVAECDLQCGTIDDGCGGELSCGIGCSEGETCQDHSCAIFECNTTVNPHAYDGDWIVDDTDTETDIAGLAGITCITGSLTIQSTTVSDLTGLESLALIGNQLKIRYNTNLVSLSGIESLTSIGGFLEISNNQSLTNLAGLESLSFVYGHIAIFLNDNLISLQGLNSLTGVGGYLGVFRNGNLTSLEQLESLQEITDLLGVWYNHSLTVLGMELLSSAGRVSIQNNSSLSQSLVDNLVDRLGVTNIPNRADSQFGVINQTGICIPTSCSAEGWNCGTVPNCGLDDLQCGVCSDDYSEMSRWEECLCNQCHTCGPGGTMAANCFLTDECRCVADRNGCAIQY